MKNETEKKTRRIFISLWKHESRPACKITSVYEGDKLPVFSFSGYNPFPCYSMVASYNAVYNWMENNGWENVGKVTSIYHTDEIDSATGEVYYTYVSRKEILVTPKPKPEDFLGCNDEVVLVDDDDEFM